ncbi:hypothetical protein Taro_031087 [Colocasia esculenta]|uniref:Uncharacterized protein n=1 Tax=Colocasia esculenta TaxID=4460 RepID=A0A843VY13_COLES|nr:hypothetical protein [Colocasia esculenta]
MLGFPKDKKGAKHLISYIVGPVDSWAILGEITTKTWDLSTMTTNLSVISSVWEGMPISQAVLGYLYAGLSSTSTGRPFFGSVIALECWMGIRICYKVTDDASIKLCVATPGYSIPVVCLPSDVATAVRVATSEEASLRSGATLSRHEVVFVSWDPHPREPVEGVLRAMSVLEVVLLVGPRPCGGLRWSCLCFSVSVGACRGVASAFSLTPLVLLQSFPTALDGRDSLSQEFVVGRSWWRLVRHALLAVWLAFQQGPGVSCRRVLLLLLRACATSMVVVFAHAAVGFILGLCIRVVVSCCGVALWVEVHRLAACVLVMVHRLAALCSGNVFRDRLAVVLVRLALKTIPGLSLPCKFSQDWLALFLQFCLLRRRLLALLVEVLHRAALCGAFDNVSGRGAGQVVFLFVFEFLGYAGGTSCVPVVGWFASLLAPYMLSQMVVCPIGGTPGLGQGLCPGFPSRFRERECSVVVPYLGLGPSEVDVLSSTSAVVLFLVWFADFLGCLALPNSDVFPGFASAHCACGAFGLVFLWFHNCCVSLSDHEDDLGEIEWCRWTLSCVPW